jgi:pyridoxamine 5'-phosphate oxidase-like protein
MAKLNEKQLEFLENPYVGVVTTLRKDGSPQSTVVWVDVEDGSRRTWRTIRVLRSS